MFGRQEKKADKANYPVLCFLSAAQGATECMRLSQVLCADHLDVAEHSEYDILCLPVLSILGAFERKS